MIGAGRQKRDSLHTLFSTPTGRSCQGYTHLVHLQKSACVRSEGCCRLLKDIILAGERPPVFSVACFLRCVLAFNFPYLTRQFGDTAAAC